MVTRGLSSSFSTSSGLFGPSHHRSPRLVHRNLPFAQSSSTVRVEHNQGWKIYKLVRHDIFHVLLRHPTWQSTGFLLVLWTLSILAFGGIYYGVDRENVAVSCGLGAAYDPIGFAGAFAFSLQTCTTVGYTLPGPNTFFETCPSLQIVIYFQMIWSMMFNAFLFAFFYARLSRVNSRAIQVVFSKKAIVSFDDVHGQVRFSVRVYDVDAKYPVAEAHARLYAVRSDRPVPRPLRLIQPNDEFNGMLFLSLPFVIHHHIDIYSLLHPPVASKQSIVQNSAGLVLRQADSVTHNREELICPICSENFATVAALLRHVRYQQMVEDNGRVVPIEGTHRAIPDADLREIAHGATSITNLEQLRAHFEKEIAEVVCLVEGIDPLSSGTFQALQSYRYEDIVWDSNAIFHPCLSIVHAEGGKKHSYFSVDLDRFHQVDRLLAPASTDFPPNTNGNEANVVTGKRPYCRHRMTSYQDSLMEAMSKDAVPLLASNHAAEQPTDRSSTTELTKPSRYRRSRSHPVPAFEKIVEENEKPSSTPVVMTSSKPPDGDMDSTS